MTTRNWGTSTFTPGAHDALAGPDAVGIVERGQPSTRSRLWTLIANESTLDDVLDELSSAGLKALPSFAIAQREDTGVRVVARGAAHVVVTTVDGSEHIIDPKGVRTWTEELFDGVASVVLSMRPGNDGAIDFEVGPAGTEHGDHFLLAGAVPASRLRRDFASDDGLAERARSDWTTPPALDVAAPALDVAAPAPPEPRIEHEPEPTPEPEPEPQATPEPAPDPEPAPAAPEPPPLPAASDPAPAPSRPRGPFDALDLGTDASAPPPKLISSVPISAVPGMSETPAPPGESTPPADLERENDASTIAEPEDRAIADDDGDHLTISRAELAKRRQIDDSGPLPGPGQVRAMRCLTGHPNPPHQTICRTCAGAIPEGASVIVERPPLAVLAFSNAERVVVDRSVIIGRNPKVTEASGGELPRIARFDDESTLGLSRSHAQIVVEGWQMFVEDLHSRNGTELTLPGRARQRLRGGEAVMLEVGAVIHFDDELSCTVEASG